MKLGEVGRWDWFDGDFVRIFCDLDRAFFDNCGELGEEVFLEGFEVGIEEVSLLLVSL